MQEIKRERPKWTVNYNIVSENNRWIGSGHEFFDDESGAIDCYDRHAEIDGKPFLRAFDGHYDNEHLGPSFMSRKNCELSEKVDELIEKITDKDAVQVWDGNMAKVGVNRK